MGKRSTRSTELAAIVGSEPEHLVDLQEDIDLGIGQVVDLGFGDVAAHTDGVHLQMDPAPAQHLGQGPARRARTGLELVGLLAHALPVSRIGSRPGGDAPPSGEELIQRRQVDDGRMGDRFELGIECGDVGGGQRRAYGGERLPAAPGCRWYSASGLLVMSWRGTTWSAC